MCGLPGRSRFGAAWRGVGLGPLCNQPVERCSLPCKQRGSRDLANSVSPPCRDVLRFKGELDDGLCVRVPAGLPGPSCREPVLKTLLLSLLGFCCGAIAAWAIGVFVLQLPRETTILLVEVVALAAAVISGAVVHRRQRTRPPAGA